MTTDDSCLCRRRVALDPYLKAVPELTAVAAVAAQRFESCMPEFSHV